MKNGFILSLLLAACAAGGGYWFGQHRAPNKTTVTETSAAPDAPAVPGFMKLPAVKNPPPSAPEKIEKPTAGKLSLAEVEAKILEFRRVLFRSVKR